MSEPEVICVAGKNDIASRCLKWLLKSGWPARRLVVLCNQDDPGVHTWQYSLRATARHLGVSEMSLEGVEKLSNCLFVSLEFDRLIKPRRFASERLFNIHFSKLPEYRGVHTSIWPILDGRAEAGVTLHRIDPGIDTGEIVKQISFPLHLEWTSRDLYDAYTDQGTELFIKAFPELVQDRVTSWPQDLNGASYHGRTEIDFTAPPHLPAGTAYQLHNHLRAFAFWEYQLPLIDGREVIYSRILSRKSFQRPGHVTRKCEWSAEIATLDYDVGVLFNVYTPLFEWARVGGCHPNPETLELIPDWNRMDRNGWSPLMVAAWNGHATVVEKLIVLGADPSLANRRGTTPLMYAASHAEGSGDDSAIRVLLTAGARRDARDAEDLNIFEHLGKRGSVGLAALIENLDPFSGG